MLYVKVVPMDGIGERVGLPREIGACAHGPEQTVKEVAEEAGIQVDVLGVQERHSASQLVASPRLGQHDPARRTGPDERAVHERPL